jgi:hypothetical protein
VGISPAAIAWYMVNVLTHSIAAGSPTETHRTDPASPSPNCTKDVPNGRKIAANRCEETTPLECGGQYSQRVATESHH